MNGGHYSFDEYQQAQRKAKAKKRSQESRAAWKASTHKSADESVEVQWLIVKVTARAVQLDARTGRHWIPRTLIQGGAGLDAGDEGPFLLASWKAAELGLG